MNAPMDAPQDVVMLDASGLVVTPRRDRAIGSILVEEGRLAPDGVEQVMELQRDKGLKFGEAALRLGLITERDLNYAVAKQYEHPRLLADGAGATAELVVAHAPFHPRAEEMRSLRTQLLIRWSNTGTSRRVLAVISPGRAEGRSYVTANLAVAFAQLGERTLLIDADLRRPRQHKIFEISDRIGLSTVLSGRAGAEAAVPVSEFGRLSLLPAGAQPPNPQELLSRASLAHFLEEARTAFDVILIDTPPAKFYADAQIVGFRAGSVMVVARKDHTRVADTNGVVQEMSDSGMRVIGTVFNAY